MSKATFPRNPVGMRLDPNDIETREKYLESLWHLFPYEQVKTLIKPHERVLEIGFGEGYGTHILSTVCREIVALEIEPGIVAYADEKYRSKNCLFMVYDGISIPFPDESFHVAVSFQVIEHIDNDLHFVSELHRVLKKGGRLYLTTPNRRLRLKPGQKPFNRFHKREYYAHELETILHTSFQVVKLFGVNAQESIRQIELERLRRGPLLELILLLGIHRIVPASLEKLVAKLFFASRGKRKNGENLDTLRASYSLEDFHIERSKVEESLHLFAFCEKEL